MRKLRLLLPQRGVQGEDGVALMMALGLIGIFSTLMLTMLALVLQQVKPTAQARKDIGSVNAASSGLQAGIASLRSAVDVNGEGSRGALPCVSGSTTAAQFRTGADVQTMPGATMNGTASTIAGSFTYRVDVAYFAVDPTDQTPTWLKANAKTCPLAQTPLYAYLQSYGTGTNIAGAGGGTGLRGNRSQTGVYGFSVPNANVAGGRLFEYAQNLCVDAGANPVVGSPLYFQACLALGVARQTWQYRQDLTLFYGGNPALNLCIEGSTTQVPSLQRCTGTGDGTTYDAGAVHYADGQQVQLWSFNDNGHFATAADDGNVTGSCLQPAAAGAGAQLTIYGCTGGTSDYRAFDPDPEVGAGKAGGNTSGIPGSPTNQYVNFKEFGRCLDVTGQNVNSSFLIAYPCKQAPDSTKLTWNQVWTWTPTAGSIGTMRTLPGGSPYCLTAPASGNLVVTRPCVVGQLDQLWTATGLVPGSPATSYNLVSQTQRTCMSLGGTRTGYGSLQLVIETCDGSTKQRWNAPPPQPPAGLNNIEEGSTPR